MTLSSLMHFTKTYIIIFLCAFSFSCQKKEGCTDCNAINYFPEESVSDENCKFQNENRIGTYVVTDSATTHADPDEGYVYENSYTIELKKDSCSPFTLICIGYANYRPETPFPVKFYIHNDSIFIPEQDIEGPDYDYDEDWGNKLHVYESRGWFKGDSIYYSGPFAHHNDYILHKVGGKKIE